MNEGEKELDLEMDQNGQVSVSRTPKNWICQSAKLYYQRASQPASTPTALTYKIHTCNFLIHILFSPKLL